MDRGAREATVQGVAQSRTRLNDFTFHLFFLSFVCFSEELGKRGGGAFYGELVLAMEDAF